MTIQQIVDELKNIKEQAINDNDITKNSVVEAITDIIHDAEGNEFSFNYEEDDHFGSFEQTDFSSLADVD